MRHLNYTHLLYFWTVAREGSVARAAEVLHLTPQTISGQLKLLEQVVGEPLFNRIGRGLVLSETGHVVNHYAEEIFNLGSELAQRVKSKQALSLDNFRVGIVSSIAKIIALKLIEPAFDLKDKLRIICTENDLEYLLADLAIHRLDLVISDKPIPSTGTSIKAYSHRIGASATSFFAHTSIARQHYNNFPKSLNDFPTLLPTSQNALRHSLDDWFDRVKVTPQVIAEFDDSALMKACGQDGLGVFPAPTVIADEIDSMYHARMIGSVDGVEETYFAISPERKLKHPAVLAITETARKNLLTY